MATNANLITDKKALADETLTYMSKQIIRLFPSVLFAFVLCFIVRYALPNSSLLGSVHIRASTISAK